MDYMYHKQELHTECFKPNNVNKLVCKMWNEGFDPVTPVISQATPWQANPSNEHTCNPQPAE